MPLGLIVVRKTLFARSWVSILEDLLAVPCPRMTEWAVMGNLNREGELDTPSMDLVTGHDAAAARPRRVETALSKLVSPARLHALTRLLDA